MKMNEILSAIRQLAKSQGSYGRLYNSLMELKENDPERYDEVVNLLEVQNFKDMVDMVLYFEQ